MRLLSIIIPIYNVEQFLEKCLRSLEDQDLPAENFELICINDGSPDNSREIVLNLQKEFNNIKLSDQENQGVSVARNYGINKATGKYLMFIDPDDYIYPNSFKQILKAADSNSIDMLIPGYTFIDIKNKQLGERINEEFEDRVITGIEAFNQLHKKKYFLPDISIGVIFKADFLRNNSLEFLPNVPFLEDGEFLARAHCLANRILFMKKLLYIKVDRQYSAMNSDLYYSEEARNGYGLAARNLKNFKNKYKLPEDQDSFINRPILQFVILSLYSAVKTRSFKELMNTVYNLKAYNLAKLGLKGCKGWNLICGMLYNFSPYFGAFFIVFYLKFSSCRELRQKKIRQEVK
ncbi:MAG: glycosyltransferase [Bacteroidales bacterium]|nr:glycosyltransferase [Bacteroidales bacterium]